MPIHESGENYLEAIYMLSEKQGSVRSIDVVNHLGFSKPTVSVAVHTLERNGFLTIGQEGHDTPAPPGGQGQTRLLFGLPQEALVGGLLRLEFAADADPFVLVDIVLLFDPVEHQHLIPPGNVA
jgi:hypothetical protein